mgnify:CR=1 FL=1|tara:strand:+ start:4591 stop:5760 length:1170 start_codon:yes stop_codon:yes gene_type:complete
MKIINLHVEDEYALPEWYANASTEDIQNALDFAAYCSTSVWKTINTQSLDVEKSKIKLEEEHMYEIFEKEKQSHEEKMRIRESFLEKQYQYKEELQEQRFNEMTEYLNNVVKVPIETISQKFDSLMGKKSSEFSNAEKGTFGEKFFDDTVRCYFPTVEVTDTHGQDHYGDRHINIEGINILIEIKNKKVIEKIDIDKFQSDVEFCKTNNLISAALFISMKDDVFIPGRGSITVDFYKDTLCFYVSNGFKIPDVAIKLSIIFILQFLKNFDQQLLKNNINEISKQLQNTANCFEQFSKDNEDTIKCANKILTNCSNQQKRLLDIDDFLKQYKTKHICQKLNTETDVLNLMKSFYSQHSRFPTRNELLGLNVSTTFLRNNPIGTLTKKINL